MAVAALLRLFALDDDFVISPAELEVQSELANVPWWHLEPGEYTLSRRPLLTVSVVDSSAAHVENSDGIAWFALFPATREPTPFSQVKLTLHVRRSSLSVLMYRVRF